MTTRLTCCLSCMQNYNINWGFYQFRDVWARNLTVTIYLYSHIRQLLISSKPRQALVILFLYDRFCATCNYPFLCRPYLRSSRSPRFFEPFWNWAWQNLHHDNYVISIVGQIYLRIRDTNLGSDFLTWFKLESSQTWMDYSHRNIALGTYFGRWTSCAPNDTHVLTMILKMTGLLTPTWLRLRDGVTPSKRSVAKETGLCRDIQSRKGSCITRRCTRL
jgi:hypothetical protein